MGMCLAAGLAVTIVAGCNKLAEIAGAPTISEVTVHAPAGLLVGDSAQATATATKSNGDQITALTPDAWHTSNASVISIDGQGGMKALAAGQATISADYQGKTGTLLVTVGLGDARLGYAVADQPTATSTYSPDASTRFSSSGGAVSVTRTDTGLYTVTFAGLGRPAGGRDNVQVTGLGDAPVYCKAMSWDASTADLVAKVACVRHDASTADSKFTILVIGARAFGASAPLGFLLSGGDAGTVLLDTAATAYNSAGGHIAVGNTSTGFYATQWTGLGPQSGGASGPVGFIVSGTGANARRCQADGYDLTNSGLGIACLGANGGLGDNSFSALWITRGRPGLRYGYALAANLSSTVAYSPTKDVSLNSSGGAITSKNIVMGTYQITFAGLAHAAGGTEGVQVSTFGTGGTYCTLKSWGNSGPDLVATVGCWASSDSPNNAAFSIVIVQ